MIEHMISIVQIYIHLAKGVEVNIEPPRTNKEYSLLISAHAVASDYLSGCDITIL